MDQATINQEVTVVAPSPVVDVVSTSITQNATTEIIETLPFGNRDVWTFAGRIAAGTRGNRPEIHGEGAGDLHLHDRRHPVHGLGPELFRELRRHGDRPGGRVRDGRRRLLGLRRPVGLHERRHEVGRQRVPRDGPVLLHGQEAAAGPSSRPSSWPPSASPSRRSPIYSYDTSATLGGPIINDKLWFFASFKYYANKTAIAFNPITIKDPYTQKDIYYGPYDQVETRPYFFGKLTYQINAEPQDLRDVLSYVNDKIPHYYTGAYMTASASANNNPVQTMNSNGLTWVINPDTILDVRAGFYIQDWTGVGTAEADLTGPTLYRLLHRVQLGQPGHGFLHLQEEHQPRPTSSATWTISWAATTNSRRASSTACIRRRVGLLVAETR